MKSINILLLTIIFSIFGKLHAVSLVYNMKIRRAFAAENFIQSQPEKKSFWLLTALPIIYFKERHIQVPLKKQDFYEKVFLIGSIFNIRFLAPYNWWLEFTTGVESQKNVNKGTQTFTKSRTGFDDVVFTLGKNFFFHLDKGQVALYVITGFPTKYRVTLQEAFDPLVGTRFFGLGAGAECSYSFTRTPEQSLTGILQTRFVHFFDRSWEPILPCGGKIEPGNITDLFMILQYRYKIDVFEVGYNPTFFTNQATRVSCKKIESPYFVRNSFYANFTHVFKESLLLKKPGGIGTGLNISRSKLFDTKIFSFWINVTLLF